MGLGERRCTSAAMKTFLVVLSSAAGRGKSRIGAELFLVGLWVSRSNFAEFRHEVLEATRGAVAEPNIIWLLKQHKTTLPSLDLVF